MLTSFNSRDLQAHAIEIADSRGCMTVQVTLRLGDLIAVGDVPAGASKGEDEAQTVGVTQAIEHIHHVILPMLQKAAVDMQQHDQIIVLEELMIAKAGDNFRTLGANATLPVSRAIWRLAAQIHGIPLYAYIRQVEPTLASDNKVLLLMNIFNGGLHALRKHDGEQLGRDRIDIQEIMIVPCSATTYREAVLVGETVDAALKQILQKKFGAAAVNRADEAGFSVKGLGDSAEAIGYVFAAIMQAGYKPGIDVKLALDVAASSFLNHQTQQYHFQGNDIDSDTMTDYLTRFADNYQDMVFSIEDGLSENDWHGWPKLTKRMQQRNIYTVGDDLFVTQLQRLNKGILTQAANAILIKVNQNGTVHGTLQVIKVAKAHGMQWIVSHRSGETLDSSIADLAIATGALGLKTGDPQPEADFPDRTTWVRRAKYLRMIAIEEGA